MSLYGEEIIDRLHENSSLRDRNNPMRKIIDYGVGEWLDNFDEDSLSEQAFLESATGKYLDLHGKDYNVTRNSDESDDDYRERIVYESLGHLTVPYLQEVYGLPLYAYVADYNLNSNTLTSDNPYINTGGFMSIVPESVQSILNKKFVIGSSLTYLEEE